MSIEYNFEVEGELLKFQASGIANDLEETMDYAKAVIEVAVKHQSRKLLCDERHLKHELGVVNSVMLADQISALVPELARVALLYDEIELDDLKIYETATKNRGLLIFLTSDYDEAIAWLYK